MKNLTEGSISKNFLRFSIPLVISGLLSNAYSIADTIIVGRYLGEHGLASLGSTASFITVISSIIWGLGTGISLYIASLFGTKDYSKCVNSVKTNLIIVSVFSLLISILTIAFYRPIFIILAVNSKIWQDSFIYYAIYMAGFVSFAFNWCSIYVLNSMGNSSFALKVSIVSCVGNILGNVIFIALFGMGVAGAAIASVLMTFVASVCYLFKFKKEFKKLGVAKEKAVFEKAEIIKAWKMGIPSMLQQLVMYFSSVGVQPAVNVLGNSAIAGYSVCLRIYSLASSVFQNFSKGLSNYCAQCVGGKKVYMIKKGIKISLKQAFVFTVPVMLVFYIFPHQITALFYGDAGGDGAHYVVRYIMLCMPFVLCQIVNNMFHNFYRGVLVPKIALYTTLVYSVVRVIVTYALVPFFKMDGVFYGFIIPWVVEMTVCIAIYVSNSWKPDWYKALERQG